ncbi:MAG: tetratricopeptide repeat protein [Syntrophales bacterium]|jgi:Tfp pilus assembly protein PilF|nr:tetratricopeptide repeat protein [Syntrophales bacterium]
MRSRLAHYIIIVILVVIAYLPIFTGDFVFDDQTLIRDNPYITRFQSISSYLSQEDGIVDERDKGALHTGYYRPLVNVTYFMDYKIWGMKAYGFRMTNLILHLLACFLLYELLLQLTGRRLEVFWAVLLFAVHPIHTETVSIIVSRNNILATIFILASFYSYLAWWNKGTPFALAVSLLTFTGAVFSKEFGLMALPLLFLYQRLLADEKNLRREMESYAPYLIILMFYFVLRKTVVSTSFNIPDDVLTRLAYIPYLITYNLKLIFLPYNLHSFSIRYPGSLLAPTVIVSFFVVLFLAVFLYALRKESLVVFSTVAFFMTLLPVLNIIDKASVSLVAMRWLYLPMSFLALGFVRMSEKLLSVRRKSATQIILIAVTVYFAVGSYTLNAHLWHDQETFLKQEVRHFANYIYMGDYAEMMHKKKQYQEAEPFFQQSLKIPPILACNFINYGALLIETERPQEALNILVQARSLTMDHKDRIHWNNNMGAALTLIGNYDRAHEYFSTALALDPQDAVINRNLAYLLFREGHTEEANQRLKISDQIKPTH